jgi:hypothetical protein
LAEFEDSTLLLLSGTNSDSGKQARYPNLKNFFLRH